ncbi:MAG: hypothetical protein J5I94_21325 [Phaeodactylibacter sp.]|nr:hypothetical protein [Phaeodactylibacter sp.]
MKHLIMPLAFFWLCINPLSVQAQSEYGTPEERAAKMTSRMREGLSLSDTQAGAIHALNLKYARRIQKEVIDADLNKVQAYFRIRNINKEKEQELLPLLDERQKKQYEQMKSEATKELLSRFF